MKKYIIFALFVFLLIGSKGANAQWAGCPHAVTGEVGKVNWRIRDVSTNAIILSAPAPNTVYKLEIYQDPYNPVPPNYVQYNAIGIKGQADGFKLYQSVSAAQTTPSSYYSDAAVLAGVAKDVGTTGGVSTWGIKTLPDTDPNWTGQLTAFKAYGQCVSSTVPATSRYYLRTLTILP